ncbi:MAG: isopeptide-forming domain-containing fimbrial protein [Chromatiales bacterium]|nr:isopeptide-forming domain-containing fimbrial protein [Chromatiales bacterium]
MKLRWPRGGPAIGRRGWRPERGALPLLLERLEDRVLLAADPVGAVDIPADAFINEDFSFSVSFDNDPGLPPDPGTDAGFGPFLDLVVPRSIAVNGASYLGAAVTLEVAGVWDAGAGVWRESLPGGDEVAEHPLEAGLALPTGVNDGDLWYLIELPFGSFTPEQPAAQITFDATLDKTLGAEVGTPLDILATPGFRFGLDPLANPGADPAVQGATATGTVTPTVIEFTKTFDPNENETATGPNYPVTFRLEVDIANGETVTDIDIRDFLPGEYAYLPGTISVDASGAAASSGIVVVDTPVAGQPNLAPDNDFLIEVGSITGTTSSTDLVITYQVFVTELDADGNPVIDPVTGAARDSTNDARLENALYDADEDGTGEVALPAIDDAATDVTLTDRSIAVQKGVAPVGGAAVLPGAGLEYTLSFQVSDFFAFQDLVLDDTFTDGQRFDAGFTPTFSVTENGVTTVGSFDAANFTVTLNAGVDGSTDVQFRLSDQLVLAGVDGVLEGDQASGSAAGSGGTVGTITFRTVVQEDYSDTFPSGDDSVDLGDRLGNDVTVTGTVVGGGVVTDGSSAGVVVEGLEPGKTIFAIDGNTGFTQVTTSPGQTVTYRLRAELPSGDVENLVFDDFLPLPVFRAVELTGGAAVAGAAGLVGAFAGVPAGGTITFGPDHTLPGGGTLVRDDGTPWLAATDLLVTTDATGNTVRFELGSFDDPSDGGPYVIDLLFTVTTTDEPFADGLFLTNQAQTTYGTTGNEVATATEIVQIELTQPELRLTSGVVATDAAAGIFSADVGPAGVTFDAPGLAGAPFTGAITTAGLDVTPVDADLVDVDAGDLVTFAIVVENTGQRDAFDLLLRDLLPAGFEVPTGGPGLNLQAFLGDGTALTFTDQAGGAIAAADVASYFFGNVAGAGDNGGIRLVDPADGAGTGGAIAAGVNAATDTENATGSNVLVLTFDLRAVDDVAPSVTATSGAELLEYAAVNAGNDFTAGATGPWDDTASVTVADPEVAKTVTATSEPSTTGTNVAIGEVVTYTLTVTLPEGEVDGFEITDDLPAGMAFVPGSAAVVAGTFAGTIPAPTVTSTGGAGDPITFAFGTVTTTASTGTADNVFTITYQATVLDVPGNDGVLPGRTALANDASFVYASNPDGPATAVDGGSATVTVAEPDLRVIKDFDPDAADAGDTVEITLTLDNSNGVAPAFDVVLSDLVDTTRFGAVTEVTTPAGFTFDFDGVAADTVTYTADPGVAVAAGASLDFTFSVTLTAAVAPGETITNTAQITAGSTLPGADANERDIPNRTGSDDLPVTAPTIDKELVSTAVVDAGNAADEAVVGELVTYRVTVTVPEGVTGNVLVVDTLDAGLAYVDITSVTRSGAALTTDVGAGDFSDAAGVFETAIGAQGGSVTFDLGTITNADTDNAVAETVVITYTAVVLDVASNQDSPATALDNSARLTADNGVDTTDSAAAVTVIEPQLEVVHTAEIGTAGSGVTEGDADDTVVYTLTIRHTGPGQPSAFDVSLRDTLPAELLGATITGVTDSAGTLVPADFEIAAGVVQVAGGGTFDMPTDRVVTIEVTGTLATTVVPEQSIDAVAEIAWSSLDGDVTDTSPEVTNGTDRERTGTLGGGAAPDDYDADATATITIAGLDLDKTLAATSESHTAGGDVAIGEIARMRLVVELPESTFANLQLRELLPDGMVFLDDGTARVAFVSDGGITSTDPAASGAEDWSIVDAGAFVVGDEATLAGITPTFALDDDAVSTSTLVDDDAYLSGTDVVFRLGDVVNADGDADLEFLIIEFNALVENVAGNVAGVDLDDTFVVDANGQTAISGPSNTLTLTVVEPQPTVTTTIDVSPSDGGDVIEYLITVSNAGGTAAALDTVLTDTLDPALGNVTVAVDSTVGTVTGVVDNTVGNAVSVTIGQIDAGASVTFRVRAEVSDTVDAGLEIPSTASVVSSSLPGASGTAANPTGSVVPGAAGTASGERDGSGGVNDYAASDDADVTLATPAIDLLPLADDEPTIGEQVVWDILVTLPEGTTRALVVDAALPPGVGFDAVALITTAAASGGRLGTDYGGALPVPTVTSPPGSGGLLTLDFGDTVNTADGDGGNDTFLVRITTTALDELANQAGRTLPATAELDYTNPQSGATTVADPTAETATVVEPVLTLDQTVVSAPTTGLDAGAVVTYRVTFANTAPASTADAFDVVVADRLPDFLAIQGPIRVVSGPAGLDATDFTIGSAGAGADNTLTSAAFDLALGESVVIEYDALIRDTVTPGVDLTTAADLSWTSLPGAVAGERDGSDGVLDDGSIDDYRLLDDTTVGVAERIDITQTVVATSEPSTGTVEHDGALDDVLIGEVVTYEVTIDLFEGTTPGAVLTDVLPTGFSFVPGSLVVTPGAPGMTTGFVDEATNVTFVGSTLTVDLGDIVNPGDNDAGNDRITLRFEARVDDDPANVDGTDRVADATITADGAAGAGTLTASDDATVEVVEPELVVSKDSTASRVDVGDILEFVVTVDHTAASTASAHDVVVIDDLRNAVPGSTPGTDTDYALQVGSVVVMLGGVDVTATALVTGNTPGDTTVEVRLDSFDRADGPLVITYEAEATVDLNPAGDAARNTATVTFDSIPGAGTGRVDTLTATHDVTVPFETFEPTIDKTVTSTSVDSTGTGQFDGLLTDLAPGEVATYTLTVTVDDGTYPDPLDLLITDALPAGLALVRAPTLADITVGSDIVLGAGGITITTADLVGGDGLLDQVEIRVDLDQVLNPGGSLVPNQIVIPLEVVLQDLPGNTAGTALANTASLFFVPGAGGTTVPVDQDTETVEVVEPRLTVDKVADDDTPNPGQAVTYTITVAHDRDGIGADSTAVAREVRITDLLADTGLELIAGTVLVSSGPGGDLGTVTIVSGNTAGDAQVDVVVDRLDLDETLTVTFQATVAAGVSLGDTPDNTVDVAYDATPGDGDQDRVETATATETLTVVGPDLVVDISDGVTEVGPGDTVTYTITVTNKPGAFADDATNVVLTVPLPSSTQVVATPGGTFDAGVGQITYAIGTLAPGASQVVTLTVRVEDPVLAGVESLLGEVTATHDDTDPTPADNVDSDPADVDAAPVLTIDKDDGLTTAGPGDLVTWQIRVENTGDQNASGVVVDDTFDPTLLTDVVASDAGVVDAVAGTVTWTLGEIAGGAVQTLTLTARISASVPTGAETVTNTATVTDDGAGTGGTPVTATDDDTDTLDAAPDYTIAITDDVDTLQAGDTPTFRVNVENTGTQDGTGVSGRALRPDAADQRRRLRRRHRRPRRRDDYLEPRRPRRRRDP